jgi:tRNA 5-methylaminomethyl-2-thiouridine biosynthesis bifunctional protein
LIYDFIVVGGGVAGASISYFLTKNGYSVLLLEKNRVGAGGSGVAGAFLNRKVGKKGDLSDLVNNAIEFAINLYKTEDFNSYFYPAPLLHYHNSTVTKVENSGVIEPLPTLNKFLENSSIKIIDVQNASFEGHLWRVDKFKGRNLFLTTGAFPNFLQEKSITIRPVWGQRIDIEIPQILKTIQHKEVSISQTINNIVKIGATHHRGFLNKNIDEVDTKILLEKGKFISELREQNNNNIKILKTYGGVRSASIDYFPLIGKIPNTAESLKNSLVKHGAKVLPTYLEYFPNLYIFSGLGGYGFSLAPYLAYNFVKNFKNRDNFCDKNIAPYRFLIRMVKRGKL